MLNGTWHVKLAANDEVTVHVYLSGATNNTITSNVLLGLGWIIVQFRINNMADVYTHYKN